MTRRGDPFHDAVPCANLRDSVMAACEQAIA